MRAIFLALALLAGACAVDSAPTPPGAQGAAVQPDQVLGTDFVNPPEGTQAPEPGPSPAVCIGPDVSPAEASDAPYGNAADDGEMSLDWALTDFQPQSCGYQKNYGVPAFQGRVTVLALLASW